MDVAVHIGLARAEACKRLGRDIGFLANLEVSGTLGKSKVAFAGFESRHVERESWIFELSGGSLESIPKSLDDGMWRAIA